MPCLLYALLYPLWSTEARTARGVQGYRDATLPTPLLQLFGDASCDGLVNAVDALLILQFSAALLSPLPCGDNVDVNLDGLVDVIDATLILQLGVRLIAPLPV